jgi:hypothetical protein
MSPNTPASFSVDGLIPVKSQMLLEHILHNYPCGHIFPSSYSFVTMEEVMLLSSKAIPLPECLISDSGMDQVVECLPRKSEALGSNPNTTTR